MIQFPFLALLLVSSLCVAELDPPLWDASYLAASERVSERMRESEQTKNVILFVGDGMSLATVTAARIFEGQSLGLDGEEHFLSFERFDRSALAKTWNVDSQVPDSAGTATAMLSGVKTRIGVVGVAAGVELESCDGIEEGSVPTLLELAETRGLKTGVVTTTEFTHATPASTYAHVSSRQWDAEAPCGLDIASQFLEFSQGDGIEVALGGGRDQFADRPDGRDLVKDWREKHPSGSFVSNAEELAQANALPIFGLFHDSHMSFEADRSETSEPSLAEMTEVAIRHLSGGDAGFFLLVEGGRIDHAHHFGNAYRALVDTLAFAKAVETATKLTDSEETLIIVTADHGHTLTMGGYPIRGNPILGLVREQEDELALDAHGHPYTTLVYGNGPGYRETPEALQEAEALSPNFRQPAATALQIETHSGEDVPVYAQGPGSDGIAGVMEQNELFHVMKLALFAERVEN